MKYLLDTCVISDFVRGERGTVSRIAHVAPQLIVVSAVTLMEIEFGLALNAARARGIGAIIRDFLNVVGAIPFETPDARAAATLRASLQTRGKPIGAYDALIAGSALARGLILVSANEREFRRLAGLVVENWRKPP